MFAHVSVNRCNCFSCFHRRNEGRKPAHSCISYPWKSAFYYMDCTNNPTCDSEYFKCASVKNAKCAISTKKEIPGLFLIKQTKLCIKCPADVDCCFSLMLDLALLHQFMLFINQAGSYLVHLFTLSIQNYHLKSNPVLFFALMWSTCCGSLLW